MSALVLTHLNGLSEKKTTRLKRILDAKLNDVVKYYAFLLKREKSERSVLLPKDKVIDTPVADVSKEEIVHSGMLANGQFDNTDSLSALSFSIAGSEPIISSGQL